MLTYVVMPCLDEADLIEGAIASLGFITGAAPPDAHFIAVDNGSSDGTLDILARLRDRDPSRIYLFHERERGFVPPRRRGVAAASELAGKAGADPTAVLVLQADADTIYKAGYVAAMQAAVDRGVMLEGATRRPPDFEAVHPSYVAAERLVDNKVEPLQAKDEDEVVVDDKVCGFLLADYLLWGGLFEEIAPSGDRIHAETTRMFIRAKLRHSARKIRVNPAGAASSRRRVAEDPWLHYATVGFPREASWLRSRGHWAQTTTSDIDAFAERVLRGGEPEAVRLRRAHQLALFRYLPALVDSLGPRSNDLELLDDVMAVLAALPLRSADEVATSPSLALMDVLSLIDVQPGLLAGAPPT
ncbi:MULTISPECIES: glycosyltransferase family 2 protein [unclassified Sphingobium]|uniref:glycosyltransferase family 2 protein n=1 Tax=unclassified Sphingobium TaxID=2611147 RepID=UPI002224E776|nr:MULTISPECIES: glycosyltransferase family A protein [unclassified Sphingobium]MCW2410385.1 glycosyltransferase involved in cell wall biosynthesis [Sphingobium sp. B8D3D]MCW2413922.1 glycosyltransferase involved in cell wall biosynthesis [Sphingobium sp. B8D3A]